MLDMIVGPTSPWGTKNYKNLFRMDSREEKPHLKYTQQEMTLRNEKELG